MASNTERLKPYAEIYLLVSPDGKQYVGKANCISKGQLYGTIGRWKGHVRDSRANGGGRCRLLNIEIRKHNELGFKIMPILTCLRDDVGTFEKHFIKEFNTQNCKNPNGLNIYEGGNSGHTIPEDTRALMAESRKKYALENPDKVAHTSNTKKLISEALINNVVRVGHTGQVLPKYVKYVNWKDRKGYEIVSHPGCKNKYFVSTKDVTKEELDAFYERCVQALDELGSSHSQLKSANT